MSYYSGIFLIECKAKRSVLLKQEVGGFLFRGD
jgi:hypothetical protein